MRMNLTSFIVKSRTRNYAEVWRGMLYRQSTEIHLFTVNLADHKPKCKTFRVVFNLMQTLVLPGLNPLRLQHSGCSNRPIITRTLGGWSSLCAFLEMLMSPLKIRRKRKPIAMHYYHHHNHRFPNIYRACRIWFFPMIIIIIMWLELNPHFQPLEVWHTCRHSNKMFFVRSPLVVTCTILSRL